ncbi:MAG: protein NosL [Deltaproteobacteria bacterium]|nr:protein NosL [Deltaproteobacteria bacterium]
MRMRALLALVIASLVLGCGDPGHGPAAIAFGRDACAHCAMVISDKRFAMQVRSGGRVHRFDDPGCAIEWLDQQPGQGAGATELWVMDEDRQEWLDARSAFYRPGQRTPMAYGFGAIAAPENGSLDFDAFRRRIRERERPGSRTQP